MTDNMNTSMEVAPDNSLLTLTEACGKLKVSRSTFWKLRNEYALPVVRVAGIVRIRASALDTWLERHTKTNNGEVEQCA